jgi:hypothetical protein
MAGRRFLSTFQDAEIFLRPVGEEITTDYFDVIQSPMDTWSLENRFKRYENFYKRPQVFVVDIALEWDNAQQFNLPESPEYHNPRDLFQKSKADPRRSSPSRDW